MAVISDNFNRPNTVAGDLGPNWQVSNFASLRIRSGRVEGAGVALFTAVQTDANAQMVTGLFRLEQSLPFLRRAAVIARGGQEVMGNVLTDTGYLLGFEIQNTTLQFVIWKRISGALFELARSVDSFLVPIGSDVAVRAFVENNSLRIRDVNSGNILVEVADLDLTGVGYCGVDLGVDGQNENISFDNFFCEDLVGAVPPIRPSLTVDDVTSTKVCLHATPFYDQNLDTHKSTRWQVAKEANAFGGPLFADVTINTGETPADIELTEKCFTGLEPGTRYCARVAYIDSDDMVSEWSPIVCFTTKYVLEGVNLKLFAEETYEVSCTEAPSDFWRYTLFIQEQLQQVGVTRIEGPDGLYQYGDIIPFCLINDMNSKMLEIRAAWGLQVLGCEAGRIEIPFDANTPRPISVKHNCGKYPIVQVIELDPNVGYPYPGPYNPLSPSPYNPGPYSVVDEDFNNFPGEPAAQQLWVQQVDQNEFRVMTTVARGLIIAIF